MKDGIIQLDTNRAKQFGFTSKKFAGYLWKKDKYILISLIESLNEGQGNLSRLFNAILRKGYGIKVPTPSVRMEKILKLKSFKQTFEYDKNYRDMVELWVKEANKKI